MTGQGSRRSDGPDDVPRMVNSDPLTDSGEGASDQRGRLSNPAQRRLTDAEIGDLVARYEAGSTIEMLASTFGIHRTTVMTHLGRRGIPHRTPRKLTAVMVAGAAHRYASGETLAEIAANLGIAPSTLTRELQLAGITIRRRIRPRSD